MEDSLATNDFENAGGLGNLMILDQQLERIQEFQSYNEKSHILPKKNLNDLKSRLFQKFPIRAWPLDTLILAS